LKDEDRRMKDENPAAFAKPAASQGGQILIADSWPSLD
jgi:hypothetical protein